MAEAALNAQNWAALLRLELRAAADRTRLVPIERRGPLSVQRPFYPEGEVCHVYLLHPPGGVVGGDRLELCLDLQARAKALFTTPGAAKFYQSAGATAQVRQVFELAAGAELVEHHPDREDVGARVGQRGEFPLLGRGIHDRAQELAGEWKQNWKAWANVLRRKPVVICLMSSTS